MVPKIDSLRVSLCRTCALQFYSKAISPLTDHLQNSEPGSAKLFAVLGINCAKRSLQLWRNPMKDTHHPSFLSPGFCFGPVQPAWLGEVDA